ncbi:putative retrotransposon protein [Klebsormidium nitens]|uniref:Putative retrotransposon protein n=1 Tax=Klebsormidium nitens TaxID=105231 RepID=A0A1Y1IKP5_KLENI|nr:putative retrotransposon protein [Klebsormidium nitens]|eukprot:GAQ91263.1 putative retrotransposon protein [Klebsormidium nitens]
MPELVDDEPRTPPAVPNPVFSHSAWLSAPTRHGKRWRADWRRPHSTTVRQLTYMDDTVTWIHQPTADSEEDEPTPADAEPLCCSPVTMPKDPPDEPDRGIILTSPQAMRRFFNTMAQQGDYSDEYATAQIDTYTQAHRRFNVDEFLHPVPTSLLEKIPPEFRASVLLAEAESEAISPDPDSGQRDHADWDNNPFGLHLPAVQLATECAQVEAQSLPRLPDAEQIDTGDIKPIKKGSRAHSPFEKEEIDRQLKPMEDYNVVRPSSSPFAAPVVLARKKNGKWRFCVDYRDINAATIPNSYPLPRIESIFSKLGPAKQFTSLDAQSGYWQIRMHPDDIPKTAFLTHRGLFEFLRMPFGLTGASGTYQMAMDQTLKEEINGPNPVVTQYLDDTLLYTEHFDDHLLALDRILTKLEAINLKLCPSKCQFGADETEHLGHLIRHNQLLPTRRRIFIPRFAALAKPLHDLTKIGVPYIWGDDQERAFYLMKQALMDARALTRPDYTKPFLLDTDFSKLGIGATLSQLDDEGKECPVAFASRALHGGEVNYSVTDGELLAMVWAITDKFRSHLYGGPTFTVRVDHNPLVWLHQLTNLTGRLARWHCKLLEFNFKVIYRPGRLHSNVDPLSRNPVETLPWASNEDPDELPSYAAPDFEYPPTHPHVRILQVAWDGDFCEGWSLNHLSSLPRYPTGTKKRRWNSKPRT